MDFVQLRLLLIVIRRRYLLVCACAGLALTVAIVYCAVATRIYEASGSLLVEYNRETFAKSSADLGQSRQFDDVSTQTKVLQSPVLIDRALASLQPFQMDPLMANLPAEEQRKMVERNLQVSTPRQTRIINLAYRSPTPAAATALVQALTDAYLKFANETHRTNAREVLEVMTKQKVELEKQLIDADQQVLTMRQEVGVIQSENVRTSMQQKRMQAMESELLKAQVNAMRAASAYRQFANADGSAGSIDSFLSRITGNLGQVLMSDSLGIRSESMKYWESQAQEHLIKDQVDLLRLAETYGPEHPKIKSLKTRIEMQKSFLKNPEAGREGKLEKRTEQVTELVKKMTYQDLMEAQAIEQNLLQKIEHEKAEAAKMNDKHLRLQMMESKQERLKSFYDVVLKRMKELDIGENLSQINVTVVGQPTLLKNPVSPRITMILFLALSAGPLMGIGLVILLDRLDNKFYGPEDIQHLLEVPIIGNVPTFKTDLPCVPAMLMSQAPDIPAAETFRSIRTWLFFAKEVQMFSVSSPLQGDGKSTVIANLATAVAQTGKRTLLVDCDLRRPRQHTQWTLTPSRGISYLLQKSLSSPEAIAAEIRSSGVGLLDILPVGSIPAHPAELLEKAELLEILQWAKTSYDYVLIDAPPLLPVADTGTIARLVDGMILVVNVRTNGRGAAYQAKDRIVSSGGTLLGVIANEISSKSRYGYGDGYGYGYGYGEGYKADPETTEQEDKIKLSDAA